MIVRQILRAERGIIFFIAVQRVDGARVKRGEPAARKIIFHLGFHRFHGGSGGFGVHAERQHGRVGFGFFPPIGIRAGFGKKLIHLGLTHAGLAAHVRVRAETVDDVGYGRLRCVVARGIGGHNAVAVEQLCGKRRGGGGGFVKRNFIIVALGQNLPRKIGD